MSSFSYSLVALLLAAVLVWQLVSGTALGSWWFPRATRRDNPGAYWVAVAIQGAILFVTLWLGISAANLWVGVAKAGYTLKEELPIFLLFGVPAIVAIFLKWRIF